MFKIFSLVVCVALIFSLCACSSNSLETSLEEEIESDSIVSEVEESETVCEHTFKEEVQKEAGYGVDGYKVKYCTKCQETEYIAIPALQEIFEVTVEDKVGVMDDESGVVVFEIVIKNISDKKISSISGTLTIMPPDGILELLCDFDDIELEPYASITLDDYGYTFEYDATKDTVEKKVYEADFEDLTFSFKPSKVVAE